MSITVVVLDEPEPKPPVSKVDYLCFKGMFFALRVSFSEDIAQAVKFG